METIKLLAITLARSLVIFFTFKYASSRKRSPSLYKMRLKIRHPCGGYFQLHAAKLEKTWLKVRFMKKLIKSVAATCLVVWAIAYCKPASAADDIPLPSGQWQTVIHDSDNNTVSIDQGTIARQGNFASFWTQTISPKAKVAISRVYAVGDCSSGAFQALWVAQANWRGKILANNKVNDPVSIIPSDSSDKLLLDAVCKNQNPPVTTQAFQAKMQAQLESLAHSRQTTADKLINTRIYAFPIPHSEY